MPPHSLQPWTHRKSAFLVMAMQRGVAKYHPLSDSPGSDTNLRGAGVGGNHAIREVHRLLKIPGQDESHSMTVAGAVRTAGGA